MNLSVDRKRSLRMQTPKISKNFKHFIDPKIFAIFIVIKRCKSVQILQPFVKSCKTFF